MSVDLGTRAQLAVTEALHAIHADLPDDERRTVTAIIEHAMADAVRVATQEACGVIESHMGPEMDKAHQLRDEINRRHTALIANLSGMR